MSDDRDLRTYTRRGALALMGVGGLVGASETLGFSNATSSRGLNLGVSSDDNAVLTITATPDDGTGTEDTLDAFSDDSPATPPVEVSFTNETDAPTERAGLDVEVTGGTIDQSPDGSDTFTTELSANGENDDTETIIVDNDTGGTESATIDINNAVFTNGTSISLSRSFVVASPVTDLTTDPTDADNPSVTTGDSLDISVTAEDTTDSDTLSNVSITTTVSSTDDNISINNLSGEKSTGSDSNQATFSPTFENTGNSNSIATIKFTADRVSTTLTVTVNH